MNSIKWLILIFTLASTPIAQAVTITFTNNEDLTITDTQFEKLKKASVTINDMAEDFSGTVDNLFLAAIDKEIFQQILKYIETDTQKQPALPENESYESLYKLLEAANYLDISQLQEALTDILARRLSKLITEKNLFANTEQWLNIPLPDDLKKIVAQKIIASHLPLLLTPITFPSQKMFAKIKEKNIKLTAFSSNQAAIFHESIINLFKFDNPNPRGDLKSDLDMDLIKFVANGDLIVTGFEAGQIKVYNAKNGTKLFEKSFAFEERRVSIITSLIPLRLYYDAATDSKKRQMAVARGDTLVIVFSLTDPYPVTPLFGHTNAVTSVAFHPTEPILASGSKDKTIKIWNSENLSLTKTLDGHTDNVNAIAFNNGGTLMASGGSDKKIIIWQTPDFTKKTEYKMPNGIRHLIFDDARAMLYAADDKGNFFILKIPDGALLKKISVSTKDKINSIGFLGKESLLTGVRGEAVRKWDLSPLTKIQSLSLEAVFLFLLVAEQGFGILEKNKALLEPIYKSLSDEQKEWLKSGKK